jgi:hypothetical protein
MKLTTNRYEIEYIDSYVNGEDLDVFKVKILDTVFEVSYSRESHEICCYSVLVQGKEKVALQLLDYADYELKNVCRFMLDLV